MTPKENLYKKYILAYNKLADLKCTSHYQWGEDGHNLYEFFNSYTFKNAANGFTKSELQGMIDEVRSMYVNEKIRAFFDTKRGMEYKKEIDAKIKANRHRYTLLLKDNYSLLDAFVKEWLGKQWGVSNVHEYGLYVGLVEKKENGVNTLFENASFSVNYDKLVSKRLYMINGSHSIDLLDTGNTERQALFIGGMAEFVKNTSKVSELMEYLDKLSEKRSELEGELCRLQYSMENPPIEIDEI